jgi:hypothetical protein
VKKRGSLAPFSERARTVVRAKRARIVQGRARNIKELRMEQEPIYIGIDVAKAQVDVAVHSTCLRWQAPYTEEGVQELVSRVHALGPTLVLLEASGI